jgi:hypothetical protein
MAGAARGGQIPKRHHTKKGEKRKTSTVAIGAPVTRIRQNTGGDRHEQKQQRLRRLRHAGFALARSNARLR